MLLTIESTNTLLEIRKKFEDLLPGLRIEFFSAPHKTGEASSIREKVNLEKLIADLSPELDKISFIIEPHLTVSALEQKFKKEAGLNVQVFRKMGNIWIETTQTDGYTLQRQMDMSAESRS